MLPFLKHWRVGLLGLVVSTLAIYVIVTQIDLQQFGTAWSSARYIYILPCVVFLLAGLLTRALRWQTLLSHGLPLWRAFSIMNVAYLVNSVVPLRMGEVGRIYLASRAQPPIPVFKSAGTIVVERLLDLLAVLVMLGLALMAGPFPAEAQVTGALVIPTAVTGLIVIVLLARQRAFAHRLRQGAEHLLPFLRRASLEAWLDHFLDGLAPLTKMTTLVQTISWTGLSWGLSVTAGYILMFAFYQEANWTATLLYIAAAALAIAVPAIPGNIGTYEGSILVALLALGYAQDGRALAFAVMVHAVNVAVHATTGIIGFIQEGITLEQLSQGMRKMQQNV